MIQLDFRKTLKGPDGSMDLVIQENIHPGDFICIYGPSGAGKTSTLNIISGLLHADQGRIKFNEELWFDSSRNYSIHPRKRSIGYVFQEHALFPNMNVQENLDFAKYSGIEKSVMEEVIDTMEIQALLKHKPNQLSGGQKQRVALARSILQMPKLLLLDEPLSSLDSTIRRKLQLFLKSMHQQLELTTIMISHDISEILKLADTLWMLKAGRVIKKGHPAPLFTRRKSAGEFQFTGEIIAIEKQDIIYMITLLIDQDLVKVVADESEIQNLNIGDIVLASSKAFNPIITRIE